MSILYSNNYFTWFAVKRTIKDVYVISVPVTFSSNQLMHAIPLR